MIETYVHYRAAIELFWLAAVIPLGTVTVLVWAWWKNRRQK